METAPFDYPKAWLDFNTQGFHLVDLSEVLNDFDESSIFTDECMQFGPHIKNCPTLNLSQLSSIRTLTSLIQDFLHPVDLGMFFAEFWCKTDRSSSEWHFDAETISRYEGTNFFLNVYFDNVDPKDGGTLSFRPTGMDDGVVSMVPKRHTAIWFNQTGSFEHRVDFSTKLRRGLTYFGRMD